VNHDLQSAELHELEGLTIKSRSFAVNDKMMLSLGDFKASKAP
jgi:hypothetical protein